MSKSEPQSEYNIETLSKILSKQRQFFNSNHTKSIQFRLAQLKKLKEIIITHENDILDALEKDLNKPKIEGFASEVALVLKEIKLVYSQLPKWIKPQSVKTPFIPYFWNGKSTIYHEPYGTALIISPWNFPFLLAIQPLIGAICAGNCAIIKPSEIAIHTEKLLIQLINSYFPPEYLYAIHANAEDMQQVFNEKFDLIFFSGNPTVGKIIMSAAAKHLTPVVLELGGKNPVIVDESANIKYAAKRIAWSKLLNAGQTCVAPDYLYIHKSCKNKFIDELKNCLKAFYPETNKIDVDRPRIINEKHFLRLQKLLETGNILMGGLPNPLDQEPSRNNHYLPFTAIDDISWDDPIMQEEIFGPILPIFTFEKIENVIEIIKNKPKSLALYLFSQNKAHQEKIVKELSFGGGCINDCILHLANSNLPFGGVEQSGLGNYHGKFSYETFSHAKSIYNKYWQTHLGSIYPPFNSSKIKLYGWLLKRFCT